MRSIGGIDAVAIKFRARGVLYDLSKRVDDFYAGISVIWFGRVEMTERFRGHPHPYGPRRRGYGIRHPKSRLRNSRPAIGARHDARAVSRRPKSFDKAHAFVYYGGRNRVRI